jgi:hypothetical protein
LLGTHGKVLITSFISHSNVFPYRLTVATNLNFISFLF